MVNNRAYQAQYRMKARHWEAQTRRQPKLAETVITSGSCDVVSSIEVCAIATYIRDGITPAQLQEKQPVESKEREQDRPHRYTGFSRDIAETF